MPPETRILVMAKVPIPGEVKTRLRLRPEDAARLQTALISDTVEKARAIAPVTVAVSPVDKSDDVRPLMHPEVKLISQPDGDLGDKMLAGAREMFAQSAGPIIVLGTDAPTLPPEYIQEAIVALEDGHDAALTPSEDGGYVLIGLHAPHAELFSDISWSTPEVHQQTLAAAREAGLSLYETVTWHDLDEPEDLERLRVELSQGSDLAPRTSRLLAETEFGC